MPKSPSEQQPLRRFEQLEAEEHLRAQMEQRILDAEKIHARNDALFHAIRLLISQGELRSGMIVLEQLTDADYADFAACELTQAALNRGDRGLAELCFAQIKSWKRRVDFGRSGLGKIHRPPQPEGGSVQ